MLYFQVIAKWFPYIHTSCTLTNNLFVTCHCTDFWIRNWSHIATHLVLVVLVRAPSSKNAWGSIISNWIWMKFGRNVLRVNIHLLTESDFWPYVALSRWRPWRHFMQKKVLSPGECTRSICPAYMQQHLPVLDPSYIYISPCLQMLCDCVVDSGSTVPTQSFIRSHGMAALTCLSCSGILLTMRLVFVEGIRH